MSEQEQVKAQLPGSSSTSLPELLMHKNRLQEYAQRSAIPLPIYHTVNEGFQHAPKFRSTVTVDGAMYTSSNTFSHRKAAEQDVAKLALEMISRKIKDEGCPLICEDTIFCKSILNEYAVKMDLEKPTYTTVQPEGLLPIFVSSLVFNGVSYTGDAARNKKEAEQLAARTVILSILGNSGYGTLLSEIIKSKVKLYAALHKVKEASYIHRSNLPGGLASAVPSPKGKEVEVAPVDELENPKPNVSPEVIAPPISVVPSVLMQSQIACPSFGRKRNRKNKKKATKKLRTDAQLELGMVPSNQAPSCSVANEWREGNFEGQVVE